MPAAAGELHRNIVICTLTSDPRPAPDALAGTCAVCRVQVWQPPPEPLTVERLFGGPVKRQIVCIPCFLDGHADAATEGA